MHVAVDPFPLLPSCGFLSVVLPGFCACVFWVGVPLAWFVILFTLLGWLVVVCGVCCPARRQRASRVALFHSVFRCVDGLSGACFGGSYPVRILGAAGPWLVFFAGCCGVFWLARAGLRCAFLLLVAPVLLAWWLAVGCPVLAPAGLLRFFVFLPCSCPPGLFLTPLVVALLHSAGSVGSGVPLWSRRLVLPGA